MSRDDAITLSLTAAEAEARCADIAKQSRSASHTLAALTALESFVAATATPEHKFTPAYEAVKTTIARHAGAARERILEESTEALAAALRQKDRAEITRIHGALSRNGFWQAATGAIRRLAAGDRAAAADWAERWCADAKAKAQAASGYPDALDFRKAGIAPAEFAAMRDISTYLDDAP